MKPKHKLITESKSKIDKFCNNDIEEERDFEIKREIKDNMDSIVQQAVSIANSNKNEGYIIIGVDEQSLKLKDVMKRDSLIKGFENYINRNYIKPDIKYTYFRFKHNGTKLLGFYIESKQRTLHKMKRNGERYIPYRDENITRDFTKDEIDKYYNKGLLPHYKSQPSERELQSYSNEFDTNNLNVISKTKNEFNTAYLPLIYHPIRDGVRFDAELHNYNMNELEDIIYRFDNHIFDSRSGHNTDGSFCVSKSDLQWMSLGNLCDFIYSIKNQNKLPKPNVENSNSNVEYSYIYIGFYKYKEHNCCIIANVTKRVQSNEIENASFHILFNSEPMDCSSLIELSNITGFSFNLPKNLKTNQRKIHTGKHSPSQKIPMTNVSISKNKNLNLVIKNNFTTINLEKLYIQTKPNQYNYTDFKKEYINLHGYKCYKFLGLSPTNIIGYRIQTKKY